MLMKIVPRIALLVISLILIVVFYVGDGSYEPIHACKESVAQIVGLLGASVAERVLSLVERRHWLHVPIVFPSVLRIDYRQRALHGHVDAQYNGLNMSSNALSIDFFFVIERNDHINEDNWIENDWDEVLFRLSGNGVS